MESDKHHSKLRKYALHKLLLTSKDLVNFMKSFHKGELKPYVLNEIHPTLPEPSNYIIPLNTETFLDLLNNTKS